MDDASGRFVDARPASDLVLIEFVEFIRKEIYIFRDLDAVLLAMAFACSTLLVFPAGFVRHCTFGDWPVIIPSSAAPFAQKHRTSWDPPGHRQSLLAGSLRAAPGPMG